MCSLLFFLDGIRVRVPGGGGVIPDARTSAMILTHAPVDGQIGYLKSSPVNAVRHIISECERHSTFLIPSRDQEPSIPIAVGNSPKMTLPMSLGYSSVHPGIESLDSRKASRCYRTALHPELESTNAPERVRQITHAVHSCRLAALALAS